MSNRFVAFALVLFLAFPCACSSHKSSSAVNENNRPSDNNSTPPQKMERSMSDRDSTPSQKVERPQVKKGTISIAGKEQEFTLTLFDSSKLIGFPLPFTTYLPPDVVKELPIDSYSSLYHSFTCSRGDLLESRPPTVQ